MKGKGEQGNQKHRKHMVQIMLLHPVFQQAKDYACESGAQTVRPRGAKENTQRAGDQGIDQGQ